MAGTEANLPATRPSWHAPGWLPNLVIVGLIAALWPASHWAHEQINPYVLDVVMLIGINIVLATSLNLINGVTGQFSLGHAGFMAVGAYTTGALVNYMASHQQLGGHHWLAMLIFLPLSGMLAAVMGLIVGIPTLRLRGDYLAIATLGFGEIIRIVITNTEHIGALEIRGSQGLRVPPINDLFWTYVWVILCVTCVWRLVHSIKGRAFVAVREDEIAAAAMGVSTTFYKVAAFVIGAFFAGAAGGLSATTIYVVDPTSFGFMRSVEIVVMVVLGGSGSITGVILAAIVLTWLPEQLRALQDYRMVIYSLLLIVMMLVRPEGLLGRRELWWTRKRLPAAAGAN